MAESSKLGVGSTLGPYLLVDILGRGNMGSVYLAEHQEHGHTHALKVISRTYADDEDIVSRFERESAFMASIDSHPGIVRIHSAGTTPDGRPYYAMEYVEGRSLREAMKGGIPLEEGIAALLTVGDALGHAHGQGLVHRDVKPDNIMLGVDGRVRLTDFGLAKALSAPGEQQLTRTGDVVGTPVYMAPEQVATDLGEIGPWTDVFGLGCVLYELQAGTPPYLAATSVEIYEKLMTGAPIPPLPPTSPPAVARVTYKALARHPSERYPNAEAFAQDLAESLQEPSEPPPLVPHWALAAVGVSLLLGAIGLAKAVFLPPVAAAAPPPDVAPLIASGDHDGAIAAASAFLAGEGLSPALRAEGQTLLTQARAAGVEAALEAGDAALARARLGEADLPQRAEVLARSGDLAEAARAETSLEGARWAAWAGEHELFSQRLAALEPARAAALWWELRPFVRGQPPAWASDPVGWGRLARAEQALVQGSTSVAAQRFADVPKGDPTQELQRDLGLLRVALARGEWERVLPAWRKAWERTRGNALDRARCLAWAAYLHVCAGPELQAALREAVGGDPVSLANARVPGFPLSRLAVHLTQEGGLAPEELLHPVSRARALARVDAAAAAQLLRDLGAQGETVSELELDAAVRGLDGAPGVAIARAWELLEQAERGVHPGSSGDLARVFSTATRLRPSSAAVYHGATRITLLMRVPDQAQSGCDAFAERSPDDPWVRVLRARAELNRAEGLEREAEQALDEELESAGETLQAALDAWRQAVDVARPAAEVGGEAGEHGRLLLARALLRSGAVSRREKDQPLTRSGPALEALRPLVEGVDVAAVRAARDQLIGALAGKGDLAAAEVALADAVAKQPRGPRVIEALRLSSAASGAQQHAEVALALSADLEARAILALRRSELAEGLEGRLQRIEEGLRLEPQLPQLLVARELTRLSPESVRGFASTPEACEALASACRRWPDALPLVLDGLALQSAGDRAKAQEALDPARLDGRLALCLLLLTDPERPPQGPTRAATLLDRPTLREAGTTGFLLRALALSRTQRVDASVDIEHCLRCARAGEPWGVATAWLRLVLAKDGLAALDEVLSRGHTTNHEQLLAGVFGAAASDERRQAIADRIEPVGGRLTTLRGDRGVGLARRLREGQLFPRLTLALRFLYGQIRAEDGPPLEAVGARFVDDVGPQRARSAYLFRRVSYQLRDRGQRMTALRRAAEQLRISSVALVGGGEPAHVQRRARAPLALARARSQPEEQLIARCLPADPELRVRFEERPRSVHLQRYYLLRVQAERAGQSQRGRGRSSRAELFSPQELHQTHSMTHALLGGAQREEIQRHLAEELGREQRWKEAALAISRAVAYGHTPAGEAYAYAVEDCVQDELWEGSASERALAAAFVEGLARDALSLVTDDDRRLALYGALVDGALSRLAGLHGQEREELLAELKDIAARQDLGKDEEVNRYHRAWRMVRLRGALDQKDAFRSALKVASRRVERASGGRRDRHRLEDLQRWLSIDPLRKELLELPDYDRFERLVQTQAKRNRRNRNQ